VPGHPAAAQLLGVERVAAQAARDRGRDHGGGEERQREPVVARQLEHEHGGHERRVGGGRAERRHADEREGAGRGRRAGGGERDAH
jgi:hypothetical protein